jgi:hypothetical protein
MTPRRRASNGATGRGFMAFRDLDSLISICERIALVRRLEVTVMEATLQDPFERMCGHSRKTYRSRSADPAGMSRTR